MFEDYPVEGLSIAQMREAYRGFKVAGHGGRHFRQITTQQFRDELAESRELIRTHFQQELCGYAYPGGGYNDEIKELVRQAGFRYARTTKNVDGPLPLTDPLELPSHCHYASPDFWSKYEEVRKQDGIFYFWGHSYELKNNPALWADLEEKLARIAADRQAEWIDIIDLFS